MVGGGRDWELSQDRGNMGQPKGCASISPVLILTVMAVYKDTYKKFLGN